MDDASPRFRKDLEASATEADGVACVDVRDPNTGTNFRFYDFEYQLALQFNGQPTERGNGWMAALMAPSRAAVDAAHAAALAAGGRDDGAPGPRPHYAPDYYGAYVRDPDGNKLHFVYRG